MQYTYVVHAVVFFGLTYRYSYRYIGMVFVHIHTYIPWYMCVGVSPVTRRAGQFYTFHRRGAVIILTERLLVRVQWTDQH